MISSDCDIPEAPAEWRDRGNQCFKEHRFEEAHMLYTRGWEALSEERHGMAILLNNRAICCFNTGDAKTCARLAGCAWHLDPAHKKAQHWLEEALKALPQGSQSSPHESFILG